MPRAMWSGSITFGLVNVPIKLFPAVQDKDVHFHMLSKDGSCRLRRKLYCPETGKEYDFKETSRGYEIAPDQYVIVTDALATDFEPEKYHETYREKVLELIEKKAAGEEITVVEPEEEEAPRVINLMKALEESLERAKAQSHEHAQARRRRKSA